MRPLFAFLLAFVWAFAQTPAPAARTLPISLERAVEIALTPEGSPRVALAQESIRQAGAARGGLLLAEQELARARRRYQAGVTNSIDVTDEQTRLDRGAKQPNWCAL